MSNPWLNLAIGGLKGAQTNRREGIEAEDRRRRREAEDLELKLRLAELAQNPDVEISGLPFVDAAVAGAGEAGTAGAPAARLPATPPAPGRARRFRPETGWEEAPIGKPEEAAPVAGAQGTPPPASAAGMPSTPFVDRAIELGKVRVGDQDVRIRTRPGGRRAREEGSQRAAFKVLQDRYGSDKDGYPAFIEGYDYREELKTAAEEERRGEREAKIEGLRGRRTSTAEAARVRRALAEDIAYDLFEQGATLADVQAEIARDSQARGGLSAARARSIERDAARAVPDTERARQRLRTQLGKPPSPRTDEVPIDAQVQEKIIEALARGRTAEDILAAIGDPALAKTVARWLRGGRQARRAAATATP